MRRAGLWGPARTIAGVNVRRSTGEPRVLMVALALPVLLILVTGLVAGGTRAPVGVLVVGHGPADARLLSLLDRSAGLKVRTESTRAGLDDDILRSRVVAGVVVPPGFGAPHGGPAVRVQFVAESAQTQAVQAHASVVAVLGLLAAELDEAGPPGGRTAAPALTDGALALVRGPPSLTAYAYIGPADLVLFMGITLFILSAGLVESRRIGMLRRMLAAPLRPASVILGQLGSLVAVGLGQAAGLLLIGRLFFGVHWGDPLGVLALVLALALAFAGISTLLGTLARSYEQAIAVGVVLAVAGGMLGGCMWPLDVVGPVMRGAGHLTPQAWAVDGFVDLVYDHAGLAGVLPQAAVLAGFALLFCTLAAWRLRATLEMQ